MCDMATRSLTGTTVSDASMVTDVRTTPRERTPDADSLVDFMPKELTCDGGHAHHCQRDTSLKLATSSLILDIINSSADRSAGRQARLNVLPCLRAF